MKIFKYMAIGCVALSMGMASCTDDLNVEPDDPNKKTELKDGSEYYGFLAQVYGGLVLSGIDGGSDITVDDGGAGVYSRQLWNLQELCTDEAFIGKNWADPGIDELDYSTWSSDNHWLYESFSRFTFQIALCNEFLRTIDGAASVANPISAEEIQLMKCEVRTLRALSYYHMIDLFGKGPWVTEVDAVGSTPPTKERAELYQLVVADLKDAINGLKPAASHIYGRVSREAGYMLLAKLYLNAGVYTGTPAWADCANACKEILKTINTLADEYKYLFCASNDKYARGGEILWCIPQDASTTITYGGTTYLAAGAYNSNLPVYNEEKRQDFDEVLLNLGLGVTGWGGPRMRPELVKAFNESDSRRLIFEGNMTNDLEAIGDWGLDGSGYMCVKYVYTPEEDYYNTTREHTNSTVFNSTDFPLFRLADTFLMLAECQLNGVECNGQYYMDQVRERANQNPIELTKENLLAERLRELYWEGHRRSDLVRFGVFTGGSYVWSWKGGDLAGRATPSYRNLYAIPTKNIATIGQNPGY